MNSDLPVKSTVKLVKFLRSFESELKSAQEIYLRYQEKLATNDPSTVTEWNEYLEKDVNIEKLPSDVLDNVDKISPLDYVALENVMEQVPDLKVVKAA